MQCKHLFEGHAGRIFSIALCVLPDGRRIAASASHDRSVRIWSIDDYQHIRTIVYTDFVWRVFIVHSPKPLVIAFVSTEEKIQVSDLETGETVNVFYGRLIYAGTIPTFHQPVIITAVGDEDLSFIDVNTGQALLTILGGFEKVFRAVCAFNPIPTLVFTTWNSQNRRSTIQTYDLTGMDNLAMTTKILERDRDKMTLMFEGDSRDGVTSLVITLGPKPMICSGHYDFLVRLWCVTTKQLVMSLDGHSDYVGSVTAWRGNEPIVLSGSSDGTIKAWNTQTGALIATGEGHTRDAWAVAVTHGPKPLIVSGSFDRTVRVWDLNPIIEELNWQRRKWFMFFLSGLWKFNALPMIQIDPWGEVKILPPHGASSSSNSSNNNGYISASTTSSSSSSSSSTQYPHREDDESVCMDDLLEEQVGMGEEGGEEYSAEGDEIGDAMEAITAEEEAYRDHAVQGIEDYMEEHRLWTSPKTSKASLRALFGSNRANINGSINVSAVTTTTLKKSLFSSTSYSLVEKKKKNKKMKPVFNRDDWTTEGLIITDKNYWCIRVFQVQFLAHLIMEYL